MRKLYCWSAISLAGFAALTGLLINHGRLHPMALGSQAVCTVCRVAMRSLDPASTANPVAVTQPQRTKGAGVVFSDLQDDAALRRTLKPLQQQLAADIGLETEADRSNKPALHLIMPMIGEDDLQTPDMLPPNPTDPPMPTEPDLAQMWLQLFGAAQPAKKRSRHQTAAAAPGGAEESGLVRPGKPASCQEDPTLDLQYPGLPYTGPKSMRSATNPFAVPRMAPTVRGKKTSAFCLPELPGAHEEVPVHHEVDTMDFRPQDDAQAGEFDPEPL